MLHLMSRRSFLLATVGGFALLALPGCESFAGNAVVIYSCAEGVRNESLLTALRSRFPSYDIRLRYVPTGNCAAKLKMEGSRSEADIVLDLEGGYIEQISDQLEDLSGFDSSRYCSDLLDPDGRYFPFARESACIAVSREGLARRGLDAPDSYESLTDSKYRGLVCMPNPRSSGTGYNFLKSLVNAWGEDEAFAYFDRLAENVYQFTSSGSGPVNALVQGEAAIGLGMTFRRFPRLTRESIWRSCSSRRALHGPCTEWVWWPVAGIVLRSETCSSGCPPRACASTTRSTFPIRCLWTIRLR